MHLSHAQIGFMASLQEQCCFEGQNALIHLVAMAHLLFIHSFIKNDNVNNEFEAIAVALLHLNITSVHQNFNACQHVDSIPHGIPPEDKTSIVSKECQNIRFNR